MASGLDTMGECVTGSPPSRRRWLGASPAADGWAMVTTGWRDERERAGAWCARLGGLRVDAIGVGACEAFAFGANDNDGVPRAWYDLREAARVDSCGRCQFKCVRRGVNSLLP